MFKDFLGILVVVIRLALALLIRIYLFGFIALFIGLYLHYPPLVFAYGAMAGAGVSAALSFFFRAVGKALDNEEES